MEFTLTENAFYSKRRLVGVNAFEVNTEKILMKAQHYLNFRITCMICVEILTAHHSPLFDPSDGKCMFFCFFSAFCNAVDLKKMISKNKGKVFFIDSIPKIIH